MVKPCSGWSRNLITNLDFQHNCAKPNEVCLKKLKFRGASVNRICHLQVYNPDGEKRVLVTKELPGSRWLDILTNSGCRVEVSQHKDTILSNDTIKKLLGSSCHGVLGQLTEVSPLTLF